MPRLPAEWEPQSAVMLTWPHPETDWSGRLDEVETLYRRLALLIAARQALVVVCPDATEQKRIGRRLRLALDRARLSAARLHLVIAPSDDTWTRDHGPLTVLDEDGRPALVDFRFNGWGTKHPAERDDCITARLQRSGALGAVPLRRSELVLEGGAIDTDGAGTAIAVRRTLIDPARNPGWTEPRIEAEIRRLLGVERMLWLDHGQLSGDDTDGHIDTLARFCDAETLCYVASDDPSDPDHEGLTAMAAELRELRRRDGGAYRLVPLPRPRAIFDEAGNRLPDGYANFLIINSAVLVPVYGDPADEVALGRLAQLFPGRILQPLDCRPLIRQGGSLHCITMQLPAALALNG